jgi:sugar-specific transcriptional regulator TrmB
MDTAYLERIGLTRNESKIYLSLLRSGTATTGRILKVSNINSGKIYEILEGLKQKGLVSETSEDNIKYFTAAPPKQLLYYIEKKKEILAEQETIVKKLIPQFDTIRKDTLDHKKILVYSGFRGIITAAEEALEDTPSGGEILSLSVSDMNAKYEHYWIKWEKMRTAKKVSARYILSQKGIIYRDLKNEKNISVKILPLNTPVGVDVYGKDKVLIMHYQEPTSCTLIYDEHTATSFRSYFETMWKIAKKS